MQRWQTHVVCFVARSLPFSGFRALESLLEHVNSGGYDPLSALAKSSLETQKTTQC